MKSTLVLVCSLFVFNASAGVELSPKMVQPIGVGETIPDAPLTKLDGSETTLSEAIGGKPALLIFYRGGWCPYCMKHLAALKGVIPQVNELGYNTIAISADFLEGVKEAAVESEIDYTILVDSTFELIQAFNLAFEVDGSMQEKLKSYDIAIKPMPDSPSYILPVPAVYLVNGDGTVQFVHYDPNYKQRMDPNDVLEEVKKLK